MLKWIGIFLAAVFAWSLFGGNGEKTLRVAENSTHAVFSRSSLENRLFDAGYMVRTSGFPCSRVTSIGAESRAIEFAQHRVSCPEESYVLSLHMLEKGFNASPCHAASATTFDRVCR